MSDPKYKVGQTVLVPSWTGSSEFKILDVETTFQTRTNQFVWGYKMDGETGLPMDYVPEGYLNPINSTIKKELP